MKKDILTINVELTDIDVFQDVLGILIDMEKDGLMTDEYMERLENIIGGEVTYDAERLSFLIDATAKVYNEVTNQQTANPFTKPDVIISEFNHHFGYARSLLCNMADDWDIIIKDDMTADQIKTVVFDYLKISENRWI